MQNTLLLKVKIYKIGVDKQSLVQYNKDKIKKGSNQNGKNKMGNYA